MIPSRFADAFVRSLVRINAGAAAMLLAALLVAGLWQDAAMDFVPYVAVAFALHGAGLLAAVCVSALRYLRARTSRAVAAGSVGYLAIIACAFSAACFAFGIGVLVWAGLNVLGSGDGYDSESHSVPLRLLSS
jgi:hypothetical protein